MSRLDELAAIAISNAPALSNATVYDGDTFTTDQGTTVRVDGIDTPEIKNRSSGNSLGDYALIAKQAYQALRSDGGFNTPVTTGEVDKYGRSLGDMQSPDGRMAGDEMLKANLAYPRYSDTEEQRRLYSAGAIQQNFGFEGPKHYDPALNPIMESITPPSGDGFMLRTAGMATVGQDGEVLRTGFQTRPNGDFQAGLTAGVASTKALVGGVGALMGIEGGHEYYNEQMQTASDAAPRVSQIEDINGVGDFVDWVQGSLGTALPSLVPVIAGGGLGGLAGKYAAKKAITSAVEKRLTRQLAGGVPVARARQLLGDPAVNALMKRSAVGGYGGAWLANSAMQSSGIYNELKNDGIEDKATALVFGAAAGAVETAADVLLFKRLFPNGAEHEITDLLGLSKRIGAGMIQQGLAEGTAEGASQAIQLAAHAYADPSFDFWTIENRSQLMNAAAAGAAAGMVFGMATETVGGGLNWASAKKKDDVPHPNGPGIQPPPGLVQPPPPPGSPPTMVTWDNLQPGQAVTLYRGESSANTANGEWWTTDATKAAKYGNVTAVTLPAEVVGKHAARGHNGADEFVFPGTRPGALAAGSPPAPNVQAGLTSPTMGELPPGGDMRPAPPPPLEGTSVALNAPYSFTVKIPQDFTMEAVDSGLEAAEPAPMTADESANAIFESLYSRPQSEVLGENYGGEVAEGAAPAPKPAMDSDTLAERMMKRDIPQDVAYVIADAIVAQEEGRELTPSQRKNVIDKVSWLYEQQTGESSADNPGDVAMFMRDTVMGDLTSDMVEPSEPAAEPSNEDILRERTSTQNLRTIGKEGGKPLGTWDKDAIAEFTKIVTAQELVGRNNLSESDKAGAIAPGAAQTPGAPVQDSGEDSGSDAVAKDEALATTSPLRDGIREALVRQNGIVRATESARKNKDDDIRVSIPRFNAQGESAGSTRFSVRGLVDLGRDILGTDITGLTLDEARVPALGAALEALATKGNNKETWSFASKDFTAVSEPSNEASAARGAKVRRRTETNYRALATQILGQDGKTLADLKYAREHKRDNAAAVSNEAAEATVNERAEHEKFEAGEDSEIGAAVDAVATAIPYKNQHAQLTKEGKKKEKAVADAEAALASASEDTAPQAAKAVKKAKQQLDFVRREIQYAKRVVETASRVLIGKDAAPIVKAAEFIAQTRRDRAAGFGFEAPEVDDNERGRITEPEPATLRNEPFSRTNMDGTERDRRVSKNDDLRPRTAADAALLNDVQLRSRDVPFTRQLTGALNGLVKLAKPAKLVKMSDISELVRSSNGEVAKAIVKRADEKNKGFVLWTKDGPLMVLNDESFNLAEGSAATAHIIAHEYGHAINREYLHAERDANTPLWQQLRKEAEAWATKTLSADGIEQAGGMDKLTEEWLANQFPAWLNTQLLGGKGNFGAAQNRFYNKVWEGLKRVWRKFAEQFEADFGTPSETYAQFIEAVIYRGVEEAAGPVMAAQMSKHNPGVVYGAKSADPVSRPVAPASREEKKVSVPAPPPDQLTLLPGTGETMHSVSGGKKRQWAGTLKLDAVFPDSDAYFELSHFDTEKLRSHANRTRLGRASVKAYGKVSPIAQALSDAIMPTMHKVLGTSSHMLRHFGLDSVADQLPAYFASVQQHIGVFSTQFRDITQDIDPAAYNKLADELRGKGPKTAKGKQLRQLMDGVRAYYNDTVGFKSGQIGYEGDYYPGSFDREKLAAPGAREEFSGAVAEHLMFWSSNGKEGLSAVDADIIASSIYDDLVAGRQAYVLGDNAPPLGTAASATYARTALSKIEALDKFRGENPVEDIPKYIKELVHRAEQAKRWGGEVTAQDGSTSYVHNKGLQRTMEAARDGGTMTQDQLHYVGNVVWPALMGHLGADIDPTVRKTIGYMQMYQNFRTLLLATLSSVSDVGLVFLRSGGDFGIALSAFKEAVTARRSHADLVEMSELLGFLGHHATNNLMHNMYDGAYMGDSTINKLNDAFFRGIQLQRWTDMTRMMGVSAAMKFVDKHLNSNTETSRRWMDEMRVDRAAYKRWRTAGSRAYGANGRTVAAIKADLSTVDATNEAAVEELRRELAMAQDALSVSESLTQFVNTATLNPNASQRPSWASDPHWALIWHLKQFMYTMHTQVIDRAYKEIKANIKSGDTGQILRDSTAAMSLLPLAAAGLVLRNALQYSLFGEEPPEDRQAAFELQYLMQLFERSGGAGVGLLVFDAAEATDRGGYTLLSPLGPTVGQLQSFLDAEEEGTDMLLRGKSNEILKAIPVLSQSYPLRKLVAEKLGG